MPLHWFFSHFFLGTHQIGFKFLAMDRELNRGSKNMFFDANNEVMAMLLYAAAGHSATSTARPASSRTMNARTAPQRYFRQDEPSSLLRKTSHQHLEPFPRFKPAHSWLFNDFFNSPHVDDDSIG